jgi:N-acetylneuraminate synthase
MNHVPHSVTIGHRHVGAGSPCFVIAEAGVNHNGDMPLALALVDAAAEAGADAVKFQTFVAERLTTTDAPKAAYQQERTGRAGSQREMLRKLELSPDAHRQLQRRCAERGLMFLSTPFDEGSADLLEALDVPAYKIPSGEITNLPLLAHVARKRRPIILSSGMADLAEVRCAVDAIHAVGNDRLILLQCTSAYPAPADRANLRAMRTMADAFGVPVGYSDHTPGIAVALAAAALGAAVIEKHLTMDRTLAGPDHQASIEPGEFGELVLGIRTVEAALGSGVKTPTDDERALAAVVRRSLVAARDLTAGEVLVREMVTAKRPGTGMTPSALPALIGRRLRVDVAADAPLQVEMFDAAAADREPR